MGLYLCSAQVALEVSSRKVFYYICSNVYDYVYVLMHDILVFSTCCDDMHGMSLYDVVLPFMHDVGCMDYMMKVLLGMN